MQCEVTGGTPAPAGDRYRFGFNGQEKVNEWAGIGNSLSFDNRFYDSRLGRWISIDPLQAKYPFMSPYHFSMNNPIVMNDPDGREAEVCITRNPNGGGTITLSSTVFVSGANAAAVTAESQKSYASWKANNGGNGTYVDADGHKWDVHVSMAFTVATDKDVARIKNASNESAGENLIISNQSIGRSYAGEHGANYKTSTSKTIPNPDYQGKTLTLRTGISTGNIANVFLGDYEKTPMHENLHLMGLGDRYSDVSYQRNYNDGTTNRGPANTVTHEGWEGDIMGAGSGMGFSPVHIDNIAKSALETASEKQSDNFVTGRTVDNANNQDESAVPQTIQIINSGKEVGTMSNPKYTETSKAGNH